MAVALVAGFGWLGWTLRDSEVTAGAPTGMPRSAGGEPSASPLGSPRAASLSEQLTSGKEADLRAALVVPSGQALEPAATGQLASLGSIDFDLATFTYLDGHSAEVRGTVATPPAGTSPRWTFTLLHLAGDWKLVDGRPDA
ncbi:hypothetical protein [Couchioplanes azureus]|uniref:hypothetical protein n=1 Tax=Couchioplanes caeruleus TaxID=56438 RepID=UPI0016707A5F|nr:hypothetical protein [Couchioplanes caeruleus]GGQ49007.1 hypothetical protein GCM10010166_16690 [Couchioplanes caeruleus subsp. azureus]